MTKPVLLSVGLCSLLAFPLLGRSLDFDYQAVDFPGSTVTIAEAINDSGELIGVYNPPLTRHGFVLSGGSFNSIDFPGATRSTAFGINNHGEIVGKYMTSPSLMGPNHGYLMNRKGCITIDPPGSISTVAFGINNLGQIVGKYMSVDNVSHAFFRDSGTFTSID